MRFSAGWFKKLYSFAGTRKAELSEEESGSSRKEMAADEELVAKKPNLRMRLMGLFKREKTGLPVDEESSGQDEPQNELEVQQEVEASDGHLEKKDTEETPSKNLWTRLCAVFKRKSNEQAAADLADAAELFSRVEDGSQAAAPAKLMCHQSQVFLADLLEFFGGKKKLVRLKKIPKSEAVLRESKSREILALVKRPRTICGPGCVRSLKENRKNSRQSI
jgi:hypothetical protein